MTQLKERPNPNKALKYRKVRHETSFQDGVLKIGEELKSDKIVRLTVIQAKALNDQFDNSGVEYVQVVDEAPKKIGRPPTKKEETK